MLKPIQGCLAVGAIFLLVVGCIGGIFFFIMGQFRSSPVYVQALKAAQSDPRVVAQLGTPIQAGWLITGSLEEQGLSGDANLSIPISGPRKSGTLYAAARKGDGIWQFYTLAVQVDGQDQIITLEWDAGSQ